MFLLNLNALTLLLSLACISNGSVQDQIYQNSLTAIFSPSLCQLKLICAITQSPSYELRTSPFMKGISALSRYEGNSSATAMLELAISTGSEGRPCSSVAPHCPHSTTSLVQAMQDLGLTHKGEHVRGRRQTQRGKYQQNIQPWAQGQNTYSPVRRQGASLPPVFRPDNAGRLQVCKDCDMRGTVCTVYSIGTFLGCNGIGLAAGPPGVLACNMATTPGSFGCGINTLHCYMSGCGLITLPKLP